MQRSWVWLCALALAFTGCAHIEPRSRFEKTLERSVEAPFSRVQVDSSSGFVRLRGVTGAPPTVKVRITAYAGSPEKARELAEQIAREQLVRHSGDVLVVGRESRNEVHFFSFAGVDIDYDLVVPPELSAFIDSSSGDVEVDSVRGAVKVDSSSGEVTMRRVGSAQVDSSSGDVVLEEVAGDIVVDSSSGDVQIRATPSRQARWRIDASSGDVTLAMSPGSAFHLDASTSSGEVKSDFPIRVQGTVDSDELHGKVGDGPSDAEVKIDTSSGDIYLRQDGAPGARASN
jgi:hypothetical protein